ncbi:MAG: FadR family transcriptional regulator [Alphaproteobacteria bacterium]|nr:FadR family transcriptional regulator [Alphaproteobacteria bacterium]
MPGDKLVTTIVEYMGRGIVSGSYSGAAERITETDLSAEFGVGRSCVREALKALGAKGLLGLAPRRGLTVRPQSDWNLLDPDVLRWLADRKPSRGLVRDLIEFRLSAEPAMAGLAAGRTRGPEWSALKGATERVAAAEKGADDILAATIAFHACVVEASGNPFCKQLRALIDTSLRLSFRVCRAMTWANTGLPAAVFDAIRKSDAQAAEAGMKQLMRNELVLCVAAAADKSAGRDARDAASTQIFERNSLRAGRPLTGFPVIWPDSGTAEL